MASVKRGWLPRVSFHAHHQDRAQSSDIYPDPEAHHKSASKVLMKKEIILHSSVMGYGPE